uniref:Uncharacterized protein n=1 Tax=Meloidogyne enterolobii TaxID=390850 RepID=A0A6V7WJQ5_MELEN|nr:unnamed protein product [Meloidogyne enterolobii]
MRNPLAHEIPTHEIKNNDKNKKHVNESSSSNSTVKDYVNRFEKIFHREERNDSSDGSDHETDIDTNGWNTGWNARANNGNQIRARNVHPLVLPPIMHAAQILKKNGGSSSNGPNNGESVGSPKFQSKRTNYSKKA